MQKGLNQEGKTTFFLVLSFLVSPLLSLVYALKKIDAPAAKNILWLFCGFLGYCFHLSDWYIGDAQRYKDSFLEYRTVDLSIVEILTNQYADTQHLEFVEKIISISVGRLTADYHVLFLVYGLCFGYFISRSIAYLVGQYSGKQNQVTFSLVVGLFFVLPPWWITGFDFWFASQVAIYAVLPYLVERKYNRLWILFLTPFIHFSFYSFVLLFLVFVTCYRKHYLHLLFVLFLVSFLSFLVDLSWLLGQVQPYVPSLISKRSEAYTKIAEKIQTGGRIFGLLSTLISGTTYLAIGAVYLRFKSWIVSHRGLSFCFGFTFLLIAVVNVVSFLPSVGRFFIIAQWLSYMSLWMFYAKANEDHQKKYLTQAVMYLRYLIYLDLVLLVLRTFFPIVGIGAFLSNPFLATFMHEGETVVGNIMEWLK